MRTDSTGQTPDVIAGIDGATPGQSRRRQMLAVIRDRDFVAVGDLSTMFGISEVTVRSDLGTLARQGRIRRVRGGAVSSSPSRRERPFEESRGAFSEEKAAIGRAAAQLVSSGSTIILDVGTTTTAIAQALLARTDLEDLVIVTNALNIALELEAGTPRFTVVVMGGTLRPLQHSLVDPLGGLILEHLHADQLFLGCNGIDVERGVTNANLPEAELKRRMLRSAARRIVVADGSKVGAVSVAHLCAAADPDLLLTGDSADPDTVAALELAGLAVQAAS